MATNPQILPGQSLAVGINGSGTPPLPLGSCTATIDNYAAAYVAKIQPDTACQAYFDVVPKVVPAGTTLTVNVLLHATSADGAALPPASIAIDLVGEPEPPQSTDIVVIPTTPSTQWANTVNFPDPGSSTTTLI